MSKIKCFNESPTKLEKYLFKMYGLYPIYKHDNSCTYAPIHVDHHDAYPLSVEVDEEDVEWDEKIVFDLSSGMVWLNSFYDTDDLSLISDLLKELDWCYRMRTKPAEVGEAPLL